MDQPNILSILSDDLGWADLSMHGSPIRTPNIDELAFNGVELTQPDDTIRHVIRA